MINYSYTLRKVRTNEAQKFFAMRILALQKDPEAFVATLEEEQAMTTSEVEKYLIKNYVLGAFTQEDELIGTLVYMEQERQKFQHIGILGGMFVHPTHRGRGLARKLLGEMLQKLRKLDHLYSLQLKVITENVPAIRLYESAGFAVWATEKNALLHEGKFVDQHHMALSLVG